MSARAMSVLAGLGLVVVACTSGGSGDVSGGNNGTATSAQSFVNDYCSLVATCCQQKNLPADGTQCRQLFSSATGDPTTFNSAQATRCLDAVRARSAQPGFCDKFENLGPPECQAIGKQGTKKPGEPCADDDECEKSAEGDVTCHSETTFSSSGSTTTRTCRLEIVGKEGDSPCGGTRDGIVTFPPESGKDEAAKPRVYICDVANGLACNGQTTQCERLAGVDEPCTSGKRCTNETYCNFSTRKCAARLPPGGDCGAAGASNACMETDYCDTATKTCVAGLDIGAPCEQSSRCKSHSCEKGKCVESGLESLAFSLLCGSNQ